MWPLWQLRSSHEGRRWADQQTILGRVDRNHDAILRVLDSLKSRFMLEVELIPDRDRAYERAKELVEEAQESLIFLDYWVETESYSTSPARRNYYETIVKRIEEHIDSRRRSHGGRQFLHRRIIQLPDEWDPASLARDKVYASYLRRCGELQRRNERITSVQRATPFMHTHFAIIDDTHIVQSLLTLDEAKGRLQRYGAIIYHDDQRKQLIGYYKDIIQHLPRGHERLDDLDKILAEPQSLSQDGA